MALTNRKDSEMNIILRLHDVLKATGLARSTLYLRIRQGLMTSPVKLGERSVAWPKHEISAINAARTAEKSREEIRELVNQLQQQRRSA
jgi:prophage regulatory protein